MHFMAVKNSRKRSGFVNRRYTKGVPFLSKWYIKELGVGPRGGGSSLYKTVLLTPGSCQ